MTFFSPAPGFHVGNIYPYLATTDSHTRDATDWGIQVPSDIVAGDYALVAVISESQNTLATPTGWTEIRQTAYSGRQHAVFSKILDGSEAGQLILSSDGESGARRSSSVTSCVRGHNSNIDTGSEASATTGNPNPPSNSRTDDGQVFTCVVGLATSEGEAIGFPNNMPDGNVLQNSVTDTESAMAAAITINGLTYNPGAFNTNPDGAWRASTILVW